MATRTLDCSDIDRYLGVPVDSSELREPISVTDVRRWVHGMQYPNRLHYDPDFAAESCWGRIIAPQSFAIACDDGHGAAPACVGKIPESHLLFGGDEWFFRDVRIRPGDRVSVLRALRTLVKRERLELWSVTLHHEKADLEWFGPKYPYRPKSARKLRP